MPGDPIPTEVVSCAVSQEGYIRRQVKRQSRRKRETDFEAGTITGLSK